MKTDLRWILSLALGLLAGCGTPPPHSGVILESRSDRELGVSTRFGIVSLGRTQREGQVDVVAFYGDGSARELGIVIPISEALCRVEVPFPTPWCEVSTSMPTPGEELLLAGYDEEENLWTESVMVEQPGASSGLLLTYPTDIPAAWLVPGVGVYRWEFNRWRLVGLLAGEATYKERLWLVAYGPLQLATFVASFHNRDEPEERVYRADVRPR